MEFCSPHNYALYQNASLSASEVMERQKEWKTLTFIEVYLDLSLYNRSMFAKQFIAILNACCVLVTICINFLSVPASVTFVSEDGTSRGLVTFRCWLVLGRDSTQPQVCLAPDTVSFPSLPTVF